MENTRFTAEFCGKTVLGFCRFPESSLTPLAADLSLTLSKAGLLHCQQYFLTEALRDPTVGELKFIAALAMRMNDLPEALVLDGLSFDNEGDARVFADVMRQREALGLNGALTLTDILYTVTEYLARGGRRVQSHATSRLYVGEAAYIAARANTACPKLQLGNAGAALLPPAPQHSQRAGDVILALSAQEDGTLADTVDGFFSRFGDFSSTPFALIGPEGLGPHLAHLRVGAELDLMPLSDFDASRGAPALLDALKNTLLLTCPPDTALSLLREGAPLALIGRLTAGDTLAVRYGMQPLLSLSRKFLATFRATRHVSVTVPAYEKAPLADAPLLCEDNDTLLCGIALDNAPEKALCNLLEAAFERGCSFESARLGGVLSLPLGASESAFGKAVSLMLPLHRFAAELALPTEHLRVITAEKGSAPSLTLFLAAPKTGEVREKNTLMTALLAGDFATVRRLIYPRTAEK